MSVKPGGVLIPASPILPRKDLTEILELVLKGRVGIFWGGGKALQRAHTAHVEARKPETKWLIGEVLGNLQQRFCALEDRVMDMRGKVGKAQTPS